MAVGRRAHQREWSQPRWVLDFGRDRGGSAKTHGRLRLHRRNLKGNVSSSGMSIEANMTEKLLHLLTGVDRIKKVIKGESLPKSAFKEVLGWYGSDVPAIFVTPDLILVLENPTKQPDEVVLVAIELKYFSSDIATDKKDWRKAFREVGQPLRSLIFGFDLVILWHVFGQGVKDESIEKYAALCKEVIIGLQLPMVYFSTKISEQSFKVYSPWTWSDPQDINRLTSDIVRHLIVDVKEVQRNPILRTQNVLQRRKALRTALNVP